MNNSERRQQRIIVGWSLNMPQGELAGYSLEGALNELERQLFDLSTQKRLDLVAPDKSTDVEVKKRVARLEKALAGISFKAIAEEEGTSPAAVRDNIKDTIARLRWAAYPRS